jgi:hypothetical protein
MLGPGSVALSVVPLRSVGKSGFSTSGVVGP